MADPAAARPAGVGSSSRPEQAATPPASRTAISKARPSELPLRPAVKKPRLPDGARMLSRKLNLMRHRPSPNLTRANQHLAPKRRIDLRPGTSLVAVLKRVQKLLDKSPRGVRSQKLPPDSTAAAATAADKRRRTTTAAPPGEQPPPSPEIAAHGERFDALVVGAGGRNIEKALRVAAVFQRRGDCVVRLYTGTVTGVDTYEVDGEENEGGDVEMGGGGGAGGDAPPQAGRVVKQRVRKASSLEVGIRLV